MRLNTTTTTPPAPESRYYPTSCTSAYCGKIECPATCRNLPTLEAFKAWRTERAAVRLDETWSPRCWTATR